VAAAERLRQGIRALTAFTRPVDYPLVEAYLNPAQRVLFRRMKRAEQQHSIAILRDLLAEAPVPPDLAVAALLHDVGKTRYPLAVWMKTETVLLKALAPAVARRWTDGDPHNWLKRGLVVSKHHPAWSVALVQPTAATALALWLIQHHQSRAADLQAHPGYPLLLRLQRADDAN